MTSLPEEVLEQARELARNAPPIPKHVELEIAILLRPAAQEARKRAEQRHTVRKVA